MKMPLLEETFIQIFQMTLSFFSGDQEVIVD